MKSMLALPGVFLPFNETIAILSYKHLRTLDGQIDVLAMKTPDDASLRANLTQDPCAHKSKVTYAGDYYYALISGHNQNILQLVRQIRRYVRQVVQMARQKNYDVIYSSSLPNFSHLADHLVFVSEEQRDFMTGRPSGLCAAGLSRARITTPQRGVTT